MPAVRQDLIASIPGAQPQGGATSPTIKPDVSVWFTRETEDPDERTPPFQAEAAAITVLANFQWTYEGSNVPVIDFTIGDLNVVAENDPFTADRVALGHAVQAEAQIRSLCGNGNGSYTARLYLPANSAGTIYLTVIAEAAGYDPPGDDLELIYGPEEAKTFFFSYSTVAGIRGTQIKPTVNIVVPADPIFPDTSTTINCIFSEDIRQNLSRSIGTNNDPMDDNYDEIEVTGGTAGTPVTHDPANTVSFPVTLSGSGTCTIKYKANTETGLSGEVGPPADTTESFLYDTALSSGTDTSETGITTIYDSLDQSFTSTSHPLFNSQEGAFKGVSDLKLINDHFYGVVQVQHITRSNRLDQGNPARAALFRVPKGGGTLHVLKTYDSITDAVRSLTTIGNNIFGFEGSYPRDGLGTLIEFPNTVISETNIQDRGIPWRSRLINPNADTREDNITYSRHIRMSSPMATVGNDLYLNPGYGAIRSIKSTDWESSEVTEGLDAPETRIDNWTLLKYGTNLDFRPPVIQTNEQTGYEILQRLAELAFCYLGFDGNTFVFRPKFQPTARTTEDITRTTVFTRMNLLEVERQTMEFPSSGILKISSEVFEYENDQNTPDNNFNITGRGRFGTEEQNHCEESIVGYIDHVIDMEEASYRVRPINTLNMRQDLQQLYNIIKISYGEEPFDHEEIARNNDSIMNNKPRELELSIPLNHHDTEWIQWLGQQYLNFYKDIRYLLEIQLQPSFFIKTGEFILLREPRNSLIDNQVFQVLRTTHTIKPYVTSLQLRTIS